MVDAQLLELKVGEPSSLAVPSAKLVMFPQASRVELMGL